MTAASTALLTDHYELTMLQAALHNGRADQRVVFEVFARRLPAGRRYGVVAGTGRLLDAVERFRFDRHVLGWLADTGVVNERTAEWLASYRFSGDIDGYAEGETYVDGSPVLVVEGTFGECVLLETLVLSVLNHDSAVAAAAARMVTAAGGRPLVEMGSRRTHEEAAVAAARAAYVAGFSSTSNLEAGRRHGIPTTGTSAHAFTLAFGDERAAFAAQLDSLGKGTTLLVDTYDVPTAIRTAVELAGPELGAIRLDSGDLPVLAQQAREQLDGLGATTTRILVTSDLDEYAVAALAAAPVDGYGVGTSVATGSGAPTAGFVYKLVARAAGPEPGAQLLPVAKRSTGKAGVGGRKWASRRYDEAGAAAVEVVHVGAPPAPRAGDRPLLVPLVRDGDAVGRTGLAEARRRCHDSLAELSPVGRQLSRGESALHVLLERPDSSAGD